MISPVVVMQDGIVVHPGQVWEAENGCRWEIVQVRDSYPWCYGVCRAPRDYRNPSDVCALTLGANGGHKWRLIRQPRRRLDGVFAPYEARS